MLDLPAFGLPAIVIPRHALGVFFFLRFRREGIDDRRLEIAHPAAMERAHGIHLPDADAIELERIRVDLRRVGLVRRVDHGLVRLAEQLHREAIGARERHGRVADEHDDVRFLDRRFDVARDARLHRIFVVGVVATRVDQRVVAAERGGVDVVAVTRDARLVVDDREPAARETVEERRFADVRTSDDRNERQPVRARRHHARNARRPVLRHATGSFFVLVAFAALAALALVGVAEIDQPRVVVEPARGRADLDVEMHLPADEPLGALPRHTALPIATSILPAVSSDDDAFVRVLRDVHRHRDPRHRFGRLPLRIGLFVCVDRHRDAVRDLFARAHQHLLADELADEEAHRFVGELVGRVERLALGQELRDLGEQAIHAVLLLRADRDDRGEVVHARERTEHVDQLRLLGDAIDLVDHEDDGSLAVLLRELSEHLRVLRPNLRVGGGADVDDEHDHVARGGRAGALMPFIRLPRRFRGAWTPGVS